MRKVDVIILPNKVSRIYFLVCVAVFLGASNLLARVETGTGGLLEGVLIIDGRLWAWCWGGRLGWFTSVSSIT